MSAGSLYVVNGVPTISPVNDAVSDMLSALSLDPATPVTTINMTAQHGNDVADGDDIFGT